tara:strand:+ start:1443 stop:2036 length:594 start_codon:yes stop_codon:yes gene_type:complete
MYRIGNQLINPSLLAYKTSLNQTSKILERIDMFIRNLDVYNHDEDHLSLANDIKNYHIGEEERSKKINGVKGLRDRLVKSDMTKWQHIVLRKLPSMDYLRKFLVEIRPIYRLSGGNMKHFSKTVQEFNHEYYRLFHLLMAIEFPINKIITFSFWDRIVVKCIVGWCILYQKQINMSTIFQLVDGINGDMPYCPPPSK